RTDLQRLGEVAGALAGGRIELHDQHARPVGAEHAPQSGALGPLEEACEVAEHLHPRMPGGYPCRIGHEQPFTCCALIFVDIALEQGARIDVEAHSPRSSASASSMWMLARARRTRAGAATLPRGADIHP